MEIGGEEGGRGEERGGGEEGGGEKGRGEREEKGEERGEEREGNRGKRERRKGDLSANGLTYKKKYSNINPLSLVYRYNVVHKGLW